MIIDEYDTPIQQGYINGFYNETIDFMCSFFSAGLKDNPNLIKIFNISQEFVEFVEKMSLT